jgi:2-C-methyl-D-erythritol 4-phosphate cytidylyltransferase
MNLAIITAAGKGTRLKSNINKQFISLYGKPMLAHTLNIFQKCESIDEIYVVIPSDFYDYCNDNIIKKYNFDKVTKIVIGGSQRQESVENALKLVTPGCSTISIHDGVRPLIMHNEVSQIISKLLEENKKDSKVRGVIMAAPAYETIKKVNADDIIEHTIPRELVYHAQTPQTFFKDTLIFAHEKAIKEKFIGTDDAMLVERAGFKVKIFKGRHENIKITIPSDLFLAELFISKNGTIK